MSDWAAGGSAGWATAEDGSAITLAAHAAAARIPLKIAGPTRLLEAIGTLPPIDGTCDDLPVTAPVRGYCAAAMAICLPLVADRRAHRSCNGCAAMRAERRRSICRRLGPRCRDSAISPNPYIAASSMPSSDPERAT